MSKLQLRSKRRTASPSDLKGLPIGEGPLNKRSKKHDSKSASDSESSSDEFVRPSDELKVNSKGILRKNGLLVEPDFSSIEKSIFSGVSKLSDSESDDSEFEEVSSTPHIINSNSDDTKLSGSLPKKNEGGGGSNSLRSSKRIQNGQGKSKDVKPTEDVKSKLGKSKRGAPKITRKETSGEPEVQTTKSKYKARDDGEDHNNVTAGKASTSTLERNSKGGKKNVVNENSVNTSRKRNLKEEKERNQLVVKNEVPDTVDNLDIAQLLALGEGLKMESKSSEPSDSGSEEWEEVDPNDIKKHEFPKEGVQITLDAPEFSWRRKKHRDQQACLEAEMNRAFNRVRKELQLLCHKTSLLLWLAHGIFLNKVINSDGIRAVALSLIPSDLTTIPKGPGKKYVDQLLKWFTSEFECSEGFPETLESGQSRSLVSVLEQHFSRRYAKSTKELTFMFVTILRVVGMESRLIVSFQPMPLKPQSDQLLAVNSKNGKSKRGRQPKKECRDDGESEDDPAPQSQQTEKTSKYFTPTKSQGKASMKATEESATGKGVGDTGPKRVRKSGSSCTKPGSSKDDNTETKGGHGRKSDPGPAKSPPKTRQLRRKDSGKTYREKSYSENESSDEEADCKPILSPDRRKVDDKSLSERLKAAAAKRLPANKRKSDSSSKSTTKSKSSEKCEKTTRDSDNESDFEPKPKRNSQASSSKKSVSPQKPSTSRRSRSQKSNSDSDFETKPKQRSRGASKTPVKKRQSKAGSSKGKGTKVLSSDDESGKKQLSTSGSDYWVEVYLKDEDKWACIDVPSKKVDSTAAVLAKATQPVCYVLAFNAEGTIKDVTKRYSPKFSQVTVKQRVSADWWEKSLRPFKPKHSKREVTEDSEMNLVELDRPMPKSVGECKNHPLYVLKRHLLKFEAIYPPDSPSLGFVRNEAIYARQNVYTLHSREIWMKDAKVVKLGEQPYKIVKARPKYDRLSGKMITDLPLEVFGPWQVEEYVPPPAVDGKVPRNAYGNVELFKPTMLPKGCVHLQVPSLSRVAKKLRIDCAPAVVGFDYHSGGCHPTYDGFVVCEEYVDVLMDAWNKEIDESAKRREEKHEKRVYGNWRRLIKGLLIREQLKYRYDFKGEGQEEAGGSQSTVNADVLQASRISAEDAPLPSLFPKLMANIRNRKSQQRKSAVKEKKSQTKSQTKKKGPKAKNTRKRKNETSEEEESAWDSSTTEEDDSEMVLLSDEDSGSEFEDLKK